MVLPGSPALPWNVRFNLLCSATLGQTTWVTLAVTVAFWLQTSIEDWRTHVLVLINTACCLADLAWRRSCRGHPDGGSYAHWRCLPLALLRLNEAIFGPASKRDWLRQVGLAARGDGWAAGMAASSGSTAGSSAAAPGVLRHAVLLLFASPAPTRLLIWAMPLPLRWALPLHILMAFTLTQGDLQSCSSSVALAHPAAQQLTHHAYGLLSMLQFSLLDLLRHDAPPASPPAECAVLLTYLHLCLGLVLPAAVQAAAESRLFAQHQRERLQRGMAPERGWQAWGYAKIGGVMRALEGPLLPVVAWVVLGMCFDAALLLNGIGRTAQPADGSSGP